MSDQAVFSDSPSVTVSFSASTTTQAVVVESKTFAIALHLFTQTAKQH